MDIFMNQTDLGLSSHPFLQKLQKSRTASSRSAQRCLPLCPKGPAQTLPTSIFPFYYVEALEEINTMHPYYLDWENLDCYYLLYTQVGTGKAVYQGESYSLTPGTILFIDCTQPIHIEILGTEGWSYWGIYMNGPFLFQYYSLFSTGGSRICKLPSLSSIDLIFSKIKYLITTEQTPSYDIQLSKCCTDLLTLITESKLGQEHLKIRVPRYVLAVKDEFDTNYKMPHSLDSISMQLRISKFQLSHEFKRHMGESPIHYLINVRMEKAKELLTSTTDSIGCIGFQVGIENNAHFVKTFKKEIGVTPLQYRNMTSK